MRFCLAQRATRIIPDNHALLGLRLKNLPKVLTSKANVPPDTDLAWDSKPTTALRPGSFDWVHRPRKLRRRVTRVWVGANPPAMPIEVANRTSSMNGVPVVTRIIRYALKLARSRAKQQLLL